MAFDQPRLATGDANSLEQPIAVGQSSIMNGQPITGLPVQPAQCHSANRRNTSEPLVPPKPNELDTATSIGRGLASCGTKSRSQPSSGSCRLMVGGATRSEEHTSELQSLMRISYAVFCLKKKKHIL